MCIVGPNLQYNYCYFLKVPEKVREIIPQKVREMSTILREMSTLLREIGSTLVPQGSDKLSPIATITFARAHCLRKNSDLVDELFCAAQFIEHRAASSVILYY